MKLVDDLMECDWLFGGEIIDINDEIIEALKEGKVLNFFVNDEYGCVLRYTEENDEIL